MRHRSAHAAVVLTAAALGAPVLLVQPATADPAAPPSLSISIDDGQQKVGRGAELTYLVKISNMGTSTVDGLRLTQSMPPGLRFVSADHDGRQGDQLIEWTVSLPPNSDVTVVGKGKLDSVPSGTTRLAASACAYVGGEDRPTVCSTDSDELDATALAAAPGSSTGWWYWAGGILVALAAAAAAAVLIRRRRPAAATATEPESAHAQV
ncbi:DUF11 domain-containing protein [Solihabitans fulvus]|uniref:DUF11 domain-containing protein n=1 Tax=Solihabitans fulvus TaxID=1892852 RepID=UPI001661BB5E|nr:DUF11 domain-containing protein [Solihabitans fulvus]